MDKAEPYRVGAPAMKVIIWIVLPLVVVTGWGIAPAGAHLEFKKEFEKKYVKNPPGTAEETALNTAVKTAGCGVCHTRPPEDANSKKVRNTYGKAISKFIPAVIGNPNPTDDDKKAHQKGAGENQGSARQSGRGA